MRVRGLCKLLVVCALTALSACGGGGGGDSPAPPAPVPSSPQPTFQVTLDRTSVSFDFTQGTTPAPVTINAAVTGTPPSTLFVVVQVQGPGVSPTIPVTLTANGATAQVSPATNLAAGTYAGQLIVRVCSDAACANAIGGTPISVPYSITVRAATPFAVTLNRSSITFDYFEGTVPIAVNLTASATGTPPASVFAQVVVVGQGIDPVIPLTVTPTRATASINVVRDLAPGTYEGRLVVRVCADSGCTQPLGGTPIEVPYSIRVRATLRATPNPVALSAVSGNAATASIAVQLPDGQSDYAVEFLMTPSWLTATKTSPTSLRLNARSWPSGSLSTLLQISSGTQRLVVPVNYTVSAPPGGDLPLLVEPASMTFSAPENATSAALLNVRPPSWDSNVSVSVVYAPGATGWLSWSPVQGGFNVVASAANLRQGTYNATLQVTPAIPGGSQAIPVAFTVGPGLVTPADVRIDVGGETPSGQLTRSFPINVATGSPSVNWTAAPTAPATWLRINTPGGTSGGALSLSIDLDGLRALPNPATREATIEISTNRPSITPVRFKVTLDKLLPEVYGVGPYVVVNNRAQRVYVRGIGFGTVTNVGARLSIGSTTPTGINRINDTSIAVDLPALPVGSYTAQISNALGIATSTASLRSIAPTTYTYQAIQSDGVKRTLVYDPERGSLFAVNVTTNSINRYRRVGNAWQTDSLAVPSVLDAGMTNDGSALIVTSSNGQLRLVDPATFAVQNTYSTPEGIARNLDFVSNGVPVTNDGRAWLPLGSGAGFNALGYFDLRQRTFQSANLGGISPSFYGGPWFTISRDGERLVAVQSGGLSPAPPTLYLDATENRWRINPAGLTFFYSSAMSDNGNRLLYDSYEVLDRNFGFVGRIALPQIAPNLSYISVASAVAPDGNRVYLLVYDERDLSPFGLAPPTPSYRPRVYVFDSSTPLNNAVALPILGYFEVNDYPTCRDRPGDVTCATWNPRAAISPDGSTLFFAGNRATLIVPIPTTLNAVSQATANSVRWIPLSR